MDLLNVIKDVGLSFLASTPLGMAAMPIINAFLPDDKKLTEKSTGEDAIKAIDDLPPELRQQLSLAKIDLKVEEEKGRTARYQSMCSADGQRTRAKIVDKAMNTLIVLSFVFVIAIAYVYVTKGAEEAFNYQMAAVFATVSSVFTYVVRAYFGDLRSETQSRHGVIDDKPQQYKGLAGLYRSIKGK